MPTDVLTVKLICTWAHSGYDLEQTTNNFNGKDYLSDLTVLIILKS